MPGVGDIIQKPKIFRTFERQSRRPHWSIDPRFQAALAMLRDPNVTDDVAIGTLSQAQMDPSEHAHFERHWLGKGGPPYWPNIDPTPIIRRGMLRVCELFEATQKRVDYFWVVADVLHGTRWEITISEGAEVITVLFHTAEPDYGNARPQRAPSKTSRVVRLDPLDPTRLEDRPVNEPA